MTILQLIEKNLWAILSAIIMGMLSYVIGTTNTAATLRELSSRVSSLEGERQATRAFRTCVIRHIDRLESQGTGAFPCELKAD